MAKKKKKTEVDKLLCTRCDKVTINKSNAYVSYSFFAVDGRMPICKSCAIDIYLKYYNKLKDERLAIFYTCRKLDVPFIEDIYQAAVSNRQTYIDKNLDDKDYRPEPLFRYYMSRIYSGMAKPFGDPKTFDDGSQFTDINGKILDKDDLKKNEIEINETKIKELVQKWGHNSSMRVEDYMYLESQYDEMVESYGEPKDYSSKMYFKDIAMTALDIKKMRESGGSIEKLIKMRNKLIDDAKITPIDPNSKDKTPPLGVVTKMIENNKPITTQSSKYKDVDKFNELSLQIAGQLAKMEGKKNNITKAYDEWLNKNAVDFEKIQKEIQEENGGAD
jgi:hypothetical protein